MVMYLTGDEKKRQTTIVFLTVFEMIGRLTSIVSVGLIVGNSSSECINPNKTSATNRSFEQYMNSSTAKTGFSFNNSGLSQLYFKFAIIHAVVFVGIFVAFVALIKEKHGNIP
jgi:hypothetical protein